MIAVHVLNGPGLDRLGHRKPHIDSGTALAERRRRFRGLESFGSSLGFDAPLPVLMDRATVQD